MSEITEIVQYNIWSRYGQNELKTVIQEAETSCDQAVGILVSSINKDGYDLHVVIMKGLVQDTNDSFAAWETWIPETEENNLESMVKNLRALSNKLEARRAEFITAQKVAEGNMDGKEKQHNFNIT